MKRPSRWARLWKAVVQWWKNEPLQGIEKGLLLDARKFLREYDDLYGQRTKIDNHQIRSQAADVVSREGYKRPPTLQSELRTLALVLERILGHLELMNERQNARGRR